MRIASLIAAFLLLTFGSALSGEAAQRPFSVSWSVVDAQVRRVSAAGSRPQYEIDFPLVDGTQRARLVGNLAAFERLPAAEGGRPTLRS